MKALIYISVLVFSTIGAYIPEIFHQDLLSLASILGGIIGTIFGIWLAVKLKDYV